MYTLITRWEPEDGYETIIIRRINKMTKKLDKPTVIKAHGNKPKVIQEFIGLVNSNTRDTSIAKMNSPEGWIEPGQTPEFDEYTVVLNGTLCVKTKEDKLEIKAGQAIITSKGEWVQYSTPYAGGAEYIAVCHPAFSPQLVHRDEN
jgi:ethanolamine utilization protein EutQ (cupin superfamily)